MKKLVNGSLFAVVLASFTFSGCAKDRTLDDWRREKRRQELAKLSTVAGTYSGEARSDANGAPLGVLSVRLEPSTERSSARDTPTPQEQVSFRGRISLKGSESPELREIRFSGAYYDPDSGELHVSAPVVRRDGQQVSIELFGTISGRSLKGRIELMGNSEFGAALALSQVAGAGEGLSGPEKDPGAEPQPQLGEFFRTYFAEFIDGENKKHQAELHFVRIATPEQAFLEPFSNIRFYDATISFDGRLVVTYFPNGLWDVRRAHFLGEAQSSAGLGASPDRQKNVIECQRVPLQGKFDHGMRCTYFSQNEGQVFEGVFLPKKGNARL